MATGNITHFREIFCVVFLWQEFAIKKDLFSRREIWNARDIRRSV